jgi:hypothetical protein
MSVRRTWRSDSIFLSWLAYYLLMASPEDPKGSDTGGESRFVSSKTIQEKCMNLQKSKCFLMFATVSCLIGMISCAHDQQLVSITIQPKTEIFGAANIPVSANAGSTVQLRAIGNYIHPPVSKDITNQVVWNSNTPDIATVDAATGMLTAAGLACGDALISATVTTDHSIGNVSSTGAIVTGNMTATVVCFVGP